MHKFGILPQTVSICLSQGLPVWNIIQTGDAFIMECQNIADKNAILVASISTATRTHRTTRDKLHDAHDHTDCDSSSNATTTMITQN